MKKDIIQSLKPYNVFLQKKRLGPKEDGGYVTPKYVLENCSALMTYGVGNDTRYEEQFASEYKKPCFLFDHTLDREAWERDGLKFIPEGLGTGEKCKEWYEHFNELNLSENVLLKIDIETGEYDYFEKTDISKMNDLALGILLEIHYIDNLENRNNAIKIIDKLSKGFFLCHVHGNSWGELWEYEGYQIPKVLELSFVNKKVVREYELDTQDYPIKNLDFSNCPHKEDYKLDFIKRETVIEEETVENSLKNEEVSKPIDVKAVVTLTTIPSRLISNYQEDIKICLKSLLDQDFNDYEIHFNIPLVFKPTGEKYVIPEWLEEMEKNNPRLKIFRGEDYGSVTKIVDTIKRISDPECVIITADDDLVYHKEMVSEQYKNQTERFKNCAVGYDGISALEEVFRDMRNHYVVSVPCNVKVNVLQHYKTVSYKRRYFEDDFFNDFIDKSWADDVLVSAYMGKQGITKYVTYYDNEDIPSTAEEWTKRGGVTTFPIIKHTQHESMEGCNIKRHQKESDNFMYFVEKGYLR